MARPITVCPRCWRNFTLEAFGKLELVRLEADGAETRACSGCHATAPIEFDDDGDPVGAVMSVDVAYVSTFDQRTPRERRLDTIDALRSSAMRARGGNARPLIERLALFVAVLLAAMALGVVLGAGL